MVSVGMVLIIFLGILLLRLLGPALSGGLVPPMFSLAGFRGGMVAVFGTMRLASAFRAVGGLLTPRWLLGFWWKAQL